MVRLSKARLVEIADKLMHAPAMSAAEVNFLVDEFEANTYPAATDLIFEWADRFKDAAELVDFALGDLKMKKLTRDELAEVTRKLMTAELADEFESKVDY